MVESETLAETHLGGDSRTLHLPWTLRAPLSEHNLHPSKVLHLLASVRQCTCSVGMVLRFDVFLVKLVASALESNFYCF